LNCALALDANGILKVSAQDKATGKEQSIEIKASGGLSDEDIENMIRDAESHAEEDARFEELVSVRNTGDGLVHATRKALEEAGDEATEEETTSIGTALTELEEALKGDDKDAIEAKTTALSEAASGLAQRMAAAQPDMGDVESATETAGSDDDIDAVDAEFEEVKDDK